MLFDRLMPLSGRDGLLFSICLKGVFNATFNNISVVLVEETGDPEKTTDLPQVIDKLYHNVVLSTTRLSGIRTQNVSLDGH
jgi:hypothetical protein